MASDVTLTHNVRTVRRSESQEDFTVDREDLVLRWSRVTTPNGIQSGISGLVINEKAGRVFQADLPSSPEHRDPAAVPEVGNAQR